MCLCVCVNVCMCTIVFASLALSIRFTHLQCLRAYFKHFFMTFTRQGVKYTILIYSWKGWCSFDLFVSVGVLHKFQSFLSAIWYVLSWLLKDWRSVRASEKERQRAQQIIHLAKENAQTKSIIHQCHSNFLWIPYQNAETLFTLCSSWIQF